MCSDEQLHKDQQLPRRANKVSDISPLDGLTNLDTLLLGSNQISDIRPLAGLTNPARG